MSTYLQSLGIKSDMLDNLVQEAALQQATYTNNEGMPSQLKFLNQAGLSDADVIASVLADKIKPGIQIEVTDPKYDCSSHSHGFVGTIVEVKDNNEIVVRDMEDNCFDIEPDEIAAFVV